jgi:GT2 family glycosyltransferase
LCYWRKEWDGIEDYDLWLRLRKQGCKFYNFEQILVKHRIHEASAFNSKGNHNKVIHLLQRQYLRKKVESKPLLPNVLPQSGDTFEPHILHNKNY